MYDTSHGSAALSVTVKPTGCGFDRRSALRVEWWNSTPRFALTQERRNER